MASIKISLIGDVRSFVSSFKRGKESVEDLADEIEDLAKEGDQTEKSFSRNFQKIAADSDKAGKKVESNLKEGFDDAAQEAKQSGAEAAQSFSGGFDDVAGFVQETLAQAFSGFGPVGTAAGIALAAGLGAALAGATNAQEKLQEAREAAADLSHTLYENKGELPATDAVQNLLDLLPTERKGNLIESWVDGLFDLGTNLDAVNAASRRSGRGVDLFVRGLSGTDLDATAEAIDAVQGAIEAIDVGPLDFQGLGAQSQLAALRTQLEQVQAQSTLANDNLAAVGQSGLPAAEAYIEQVAAIGQAWQDAMADSEDYISVSEGVAVFDWGQYLADAEATLAAAEAYKAAIIGLPPDVKAEAERLFAEQGATSAILYTTAFTASTDADKQRFINAAKARGTDAGEAQGKEMATKAASSAATEASKWTPLEYPIKPGKVDWSSVVNAPPTVYVPGVIVKPGTRNPL